MRTLRARRPQENERSIVYILYQATTIIILCALTVIPFANNYIQTYSLRLALLLSALILLFMRSCRTGQKQRGIQHILHYGTWVIFSLSFSVFIYQVVLFLDLYIGTLLGLLMLAFFVLLTGIPSFGKRCCLALVLAVISTVNLIGIGANFIQENEKGSIPPSTLLQYQPKNIVAFNVWLKKRIYGFAVNVRGTHALIPAPFNHELFIADLRTHTVKAHPLKASIWHTYYPDPMTIVAGDDSGLTTYVFSRADLRLKRKIDTPYPGPVSEFSPKGFWRIVGKKDMVIVPRNNGETFIIDPARGTIRKRTLITPFLGNTEESAIESLTFLNAANKVLVGTRGYIIISYDLTKDRIDRLIMMPLISDLALTADQKKVYLTTLTGHLFRLNTRDLAIDACWFIGAGTRHLLVDQRNGLVYLSNYLNGTITVFDPGTDRKLNTFFIAPRIEHLELDQAHEKLYIGHGAGLTALHLRSLRKVPVVHRTAPSFPGLLLAYDNFWSFFAELFFLNTFTPSFAKDVLIMIGLLVMVLLGREKLKGTR